MNRLFFGATTTEATGILRRYEADYLMLHANAPLARQLSGTPGVIPLDIPGERYDIYRIDRTELRGQVGRGS